MNEPIAFFDPMGLDKKHGDGYNGDRTPLDDVTVTSTAGYNPTDMYYGSSAWYASKYGDPSAGDQDAINYANSHAVAVNGPGTRRRDWRDRNLRRITNVSLFDERGRELLGRWLDGSGKSLNTLNGNWGDYTKSNDLLENQIKDILSEDATMRVSDGDFFYKGSAEIENGYFTGYEMLHGTNSTVGGFQMAGRAMISSNNSVTYALILSWNDIIDPNFTYSSDAILQYTGY